MNYSQITQDLFVGTTPSAADYEMLRQMGIRLVVNMRWLHGKRPQDGEPRMEYMRLRTFDSPLLPIPMEALMRGASAGVDAIRRGGRVYVHCARGRHRGPAMAAAILIAGGMTAPDAIRLIKESRGQADPEVRYVRRRIELFAERWRAAEGNERPDRSPNRGR